MIGPKVKAALKECAQTVDNYGTHTETWRLVKYIDGVLSTSSGSERFFHKREEVKSSHIFFCDWQNDVVIDETYRLCFGERVFEILFVENPMAKNMFVKLYLSELA